MTKKGRQKCFETNCDRKNILTCGHPRTSLAPGIQDPLHATAWDSCKSCESFVEASLPLRGLTFSSSTVVLIIFYISINLCFDPPLIGSYYNCRFAQAGVRL